MLLKHLIYITSLLLSHLVIIYSQDSQLDSLSNLQDSETDTLEEKLFLLPSPINNNEDNNNNGNSNIYPQLKLGESHGFDELGPIIVTSDGNNLNIINIYYSVKIK